MFLLRVGTQIQREIAYFYLDNQQLQETKQYSLHRIRWRINPFRFHEHCYLLARCQAIAYWIAIDTFNWIYGRSLQTRCVGSKYYR
jgi:hypothetical protein